jgi:hypothetical protein
VASVMVAPEFRSDIGKGGVAARRLNCLSMQIPEPILYHEKANGSKSDRPIQLPMLGKAGEVGNFL